MKVRIKIHICTSLPAHLFDNHGFERSSGFRNAPKKTTKAGRVEPDLRGPGVHLSDAVSDGAVMYENHFGLFEDLNVVFVQGLETQRHSRGQGMVLPAHAHP